MENDNLIGRYIKALSNNPMNIPVKKNGILKIIRNNICINIQDKELNSWCFNLTHPDLKLLPIDFNPDAVNDPDSIWEYAQCIKNSLNFMGEVGKIYKVKSLNTIKLVLEEKPEFTLDVKRFIRSTKEAYDTQNKNIGFNNIFKENDWVIGWHSPTISFNKIAWQIEKVCDNYAYPKNRIRANTNIKNIRLASAAEISIANNSDFPKEGCVYESLDNIKEFVNYLVNRPYNKCDDKTLRNEAIGIGWNTNSCWWLKTRTSDKIVYDLDYLQEILGLSKNTTTNNMKEEYNWIPSIGDWVTVINDGLCPKTNGKTYQITNVNEPNLIAISTEFAKKRLLWVNTSNPEARKALPHEIPKVDNFVLPEKWYFEITKENYEKFKHKRSLASIHGYIISKKYDNLNWDFWEYDVNHIKSNNFEKITFEEFQKYVLKESSVYITYDNDTPESRAEILKKYPHPDSLQTSDNGIVDLNVPEIKEVPVYVDYTVSIKLVDLNIPDLSVKPEKVETIKVEPYILQI